MAIFFFFLFKKHFTLYLKFSIECCLLCIFLIPKLVPLLMAFAIIHTLHVLLPDFSEILNFFAFIILFVEGSMEKHFHDGSSDSLDHCNTHLLLSGPSTGAFSGTANPKSISALDLLASAYGDLSEPEDEVLDNKPGHEDGNEIRNLSLSSDLTQKSMSSTKVLNGNLESHLIEPYCQTETNDNYRNSSSGVSNYSELPVQDSGRIGGSDDSNDSPDKICTPKLEFSRWNQPESPNMLVSLEDEMAPSDSLIAYSTGINGKKTDGSCHKEADVPEHHNSCDPVAPIRCTKGEMKLTNYSAKIQNSDVPVMQRSDKDSSRMHVFCLEHAVEVEKQLRPFGGVHIMLLCHPGELLK